MEKRRGELVRVSVLFDKYLKNLKAPQKTVEKAALDAIEAILGLRLLPEQIEYTVATKTLYIKAPALIRSEIKINAEQINKHLQIILAASEKNIQLL